MNRLERKANLLYFRTIPCLFKERVHETCDGTECKDNTATSLKKKWKVVSPGANELVLSCIADTPVT